MTGWRKRQMMEMAREAGFEQVGHDSFQELTARMEAFAKLVREDEREQIAQMFDDAPPLVDFVKNDQGGCMMCGFTPKLATAAIRARGQA